MNVRTRFAPSPTGMMHVGGVRTALYAWLFARQKHGEFILRIEDTDKEREVDGSADHIIECLKWLGITWDEGVDIAGPHAPYLQSERLALYKTYAEKLIEKGYAYPDPYTEEELESFRQKAEEAHVPFLFRDHRPENVLPWDGTKPLRFKTPEIKRYEWEDAVRGTLSAGPEALDDFILIKSDGYPTYNFAHVVDDIEMQITHVMRGEEFISSTPKFLSLYDALGKEPPVFATMPVILGPDGKKKLSKRDGAKDLLEYREEGYMPEALMNFLALLGWHPDSNQEFFPKDELIAAFELSRIQKAGAHLDDAKLLSLNQQWMRTLTDEEYALRGNLTAPNSEILKKIIPQLKERSQTFKEARELLTGELDFMFAAPNLDKQLLLSKEVAVGSTKEHLQSFVSVLTSLAPDASLEDIKTACMNYADTISKEEGGRGAALWPLRYALSGKERSPDPFTIVSVLGLRESHSRLQSALAILG